MADELWFNGINGASGDYLLPPLTPEQVSEIVLGEARDRSLIEELKSWYDYVSRAHFGPIAGVDPTQLSECGWGVIFSHDADPAIREALGELLAHRKEQAAKKHAHYYREYSGADGYLPGDSKTDFLARHGVGPGPADPDKVPYYLLIVGSPAKIPYHFQYQLDVQYAVGRVHFDTLDEYAQYARSVVEAESGKVSLPRQAAFFGVRNPDDRATGYSADQLVKPLADKLAADERLKAWSIQTIADDDASKARLGQLLGGSETPALLFTASHGMGFPRDDARQIPHQGALLCSDWPGPNQWRQAIPHEHYLAGEDIASDARLLGLVSFHFACYGAGTPHLDDFAHQAFKKPVAVAPYPFVARLPQRLLGHPKGGALAVVGHVERAWGYSFLWAGAGRQLGVFE
ncbi:MAG: hypothetical protein FJZ90_07505, partial [Chloroflexi bacterium]|nr:hypothetical protein [Chloroflexota bacterium]